MLARYALADLVRNPRRTFATMVGLVLGVGLCCGVLFFVDGLSASMTQRAVAPLPIDMQRIVTEPVGGALTLTQRPGWQTVAPDDPVRVVLVLRNSSDTAANEVTLRSAPSAGLIFVPRSARLQGAPLTPGAGASADQNPFAQGPGQTGHNLGTIGPGEVRRASYLVRAEVPAPASIDDTTLSSAYSSRESVSPVAANQPASVPLPDLARMVQGVAGVAHADELSFADLGSGTLASAGGVAEGPARIFGFDGAYARRDPEVRVVDGALRRGGAVLSAEAAHELGAALGDRVQITLPDGSTLREQVAGIADLSRARSLFSSRRGGDLETFIYSPSSVVVSPETFATRVLPAYERAATARGGRLKNPPVREIDIRLDRGPLAAEPAVALSQTTRVAVAVNAVAARQDYLLDNISNTLRVAADDAAVAKRLFVFLGVPGALLAAMLAAYAGSVMAEGQRRDQAALRVRGASRSHLLRLLLVRTAALTAGGSLVGLVLGWAAAVAVLGQQAVAAASAASLALSAVLGTLGGFAATGIAVYLTGRLSIDREIDEDRARLVERTPLWRRAQLDLAGLLVVAVGTVDAVRSHAFDGASGSVYFGRSVQLNLALLVLPVAVWITGSLLGARVVGFVLARTRPRSTGEFGRPLTRLVRISLGQRPWPVANATAVLSLIVGLTVCLAGFTGSYDAAKATDARFANGSDVRITPAPTATQTYPATATFRTDGVRATTPVIYGVSNVIVRSARTSDPANLAALDPDGYRRVTPVGDDEFVGADAVTALGRLRQDPNAVLLGQEMAELLEVQAGDTVNVLLARATAEQVEVELHVTGLFERLPGFPDGVDAVMAMRQHVAVLPGRAPDFFLATAASSDDAGLRRAVTSLRHGPVSRDHLQLDTRTSTLARDQSSLAALNIAGLLELDRFFALAMAAVVTAIFVFALLLQRRREYLTLRAQGLGPRAVRLLIAAEAGAVAVLGTGVGILVGVVMGGYFVAVLRPLFVLPPAYILPVWAAAASVSLVLLATLVATAIASRLVNRLEPTELLRQK